MRALGVPCICPTFSGDETAPVDAQWTTVLCIRLRRGVRHRLYLRKW